MNNYGINNGGFDMNMGIPGQWIPAQQPPQQMYDGMNLPPNMAMSPNMVGPGGRPPVSPMACPGNQMMYGYGGNHEFAMTMPPHMDFPPPQMMGK